MPLPPGILKSYGSFRSYMMASLPAPPSESGTRHFYVDQTGVIRYNQAAAATVADLPLQ
jgi:hypothetical protein